MATTVVTEVLFELSGDGIEIALALDGEGGAERLSLRSGGQAREFSSAEITVDASDEGTRASVMLENGAADGPIVLLTVTVPRIVFGDERSFDVTAAALRTTKRSLFGGVRPGPQQSFEALALTGTASAPAEEGRIGTCRDWYASHDHMPPGPATLRVTGTCTFGTAGFEIKLCRHEPQGINPRDLLLDKIVIAPPDGSFTAQVITDVEARYEEVTDLEYDSVTILPDGPSIPVQEVH